MSSELRLAFSYKLTIIPYENVVAIEESYNESGSIDIILDASSRETRDIRLKGNQAEMFISQYNKYLKHVEDTIYEQSKNSFNSSN